MSRDGVRALRLARRRARALDPRRRRAYEFGEERDHPLRRQMLWLKFRYGVYFPWKVFYELIPTRGWDDKSTGRGKDFTAEARGALPALGRAS